MKLNMYKLIILYKKVMILQYCLSIFAVNFFSEPDFTNFKIRFINQQNGDCNQSKLLDTRHLNSKLFPVSIKIKGAERILCKVKMIAGVAGQQNLKGEGVLSIDKGSIDKSIRVPIYDKKKGVEEVAICSFDLLLTGFNIQRNTVTDSSKIKVQDWRDRSEDAIFSQMSYTVSSQEDNRAVQAQKIQADLCKEPSLKQTSVVVKSKQIGDLHQQEPLKFRQRNQVKDSRILIDHSSLQNDSYQSLQPTKAIDAYQNLDESISPQNLEQKINQKQKIVAELRQKLKQKRKKQHTTIDSGVHFKIRRRSQIKESSFYVSSRPYIRYFTEIGSYYKLLDHIKLFKQLNSHGNETENNLEEILFEKLQIYRGKQRICEFDTLNYRLTCIANQEKSNIQVKVPDEASTFKVRVYISKEGEYQGVFGTQEGEKMMVELRPCSKISADSSKTSCIKLQLNIIKKSQPSKEKEEIESQDISMRFPQEICENQNFKSRVQSLALQPWGYGLAQVDRLEKVDNKILQAVASTENKSFAVREKTPRKLSDSVKLSSKNKLKRFHTSSQSESLENQTQSLRSSMRRSSFSRKDFDDIKNLRNGNRNQIRFKSPTRKSDKGENLKERWEKILLKTKVKDQVKNSKTSILKQTEESFRKERGGKKKKGKNILYGCVSQCKQIRKVGRDWGEYLNDKQNNPFPLQSVCLLINNVSVTQPQVVVEEQDLLGKFLKISISGKVTYFTEVIFSGPFNSILWKLSGCQFNDLLGRQKLVLELFQTCRNQVDLIGRAELRMSKLYFLRDNHIYNGKILLDNNVNAEFTLGFSFEGNSFDPKKPFEVIQEQQGQDSRAHSKIGQKCLSSLSKNTHSSTLKQGTRTLEKRKENQK